MRRGVNWDVDIVFFFFFLTAPRCNQILTAVNTSLLTVNTHAYTPCAPNDHCDTANTHLMYTDSFITLTQTHTHTHTHRHKPHDSSVLRLIFYFHFHLTEWCSSVSLSLHTPAETQHKTCRHRQDTLVVTMTAALFTCLPVHLSQVCSLTCCFTPPFPFVQIVISRWE